MPVRAPLVDAEVLSVRGVQLDTILLPCGAQQGGEGERRPWGRAGRCRAGCHQNRAVLRRVRTLRQAGGRGDGTGKSAGQRESVGETDVSELDVNKLPRGRQRGSLLKLAKYECRWSSGALHR